MSVPVSVLLYKNVHRSHASNRHVSVYLYLVSVLLYPGKLAVNMCLFSLLRVTHNK